MSVTHAFPTAEEYSSEPVRYPHLQALDLLATAHALPGIYNNIVVNQINQHCLRLGVLEGEYPWHQHPDSDELFLVMEGHLLIDFPEAATIRLDPGQMVTIPAGTVHRTRSDTRVVTACFEELGAATVFVPPPEEWIANSPKVAKATR